MNEGWTLLSSLFGNPEDSSTEASQQDPPFLPENKPLLNNQSTTPLVYEAFPNNNIDQPEVFRIQIED